MRNCPQCGAECAPVHRFCPACGFPVGALRGAGGDPLIGRTLGGAYVVLENVGAGGMGKVYRAEQKSLGKTVAVKVIHPHLIADESATARFYTESRAASRLNHPNSVSVLEFGRTDDGLLYLVMEFLRGKDLAHVLWEEGPLPAARAADVLAQVLAALSEAHELAIIHRDIKPENVLVEKLRTGADFVKVVDFGLAKVRADVAPSITMPGIVCGTPDYMAPEQGRGDPLDARSDLYSCGVLLFQVLTGRLPFEAESPTQMVLMHIGSPPPVPRTFMPGIPEAMVQIVFKSLEKEAGNRYQTAVEFATALRDFIRDEQARRRKKVASGTMVACASCGASNRAGVKFCNECGARMVPPTAAGETSDLMPVETLMALASEMPGPGESMPPEEPAPPSKGPISSRPTVANPVVRLSEKPQRTPSGKSIPPEDSWDVPPLGDLPKADDALRAALAFASETGADEGAPDPQGEQSASTPAVSGAPAETTAPPKAPAPPLTPSVMALLSVQNPDARPGRIGGRRETRAFSPLPAPPPLQSRDSLPPVVSAARAPTPEFVMPRTTSAGMPAVALDGSSDVPPLAAAQEREAVATNGEAKAAPVPALQRPPSVAPASTSLAPTSPSQSPSSRTDSAALRALGLAARPAPLHTRTSNGNLTNEGVTTNGAREREGGVPRDVVLRGLPFVGRADEMAQLEGQRARAIASGNLTPFRLVGDLGSGKHRLVEEFLSKARALGDRVVAATVDTSWAGVAYSPIASLVRAALGLPESEDPVAWLDRATATDPGAARRDVRAGFEEIFGKGAVHLDGRGRREAAVRAVSFALARAARDAQGGAVIAVFEQLERADTASLKVLAALASYPLAAPVVLLGTHLPRVDVGWTLGGMLVLKGLAREEALGVLLAVADVSANDARSALALAEDPVSPLYVEQLASWLAEGGGTAPTRAVDLLAARFERLPPKARRTLQALALLGEATPERLARVLGERIDVATVEMLRARGWTVAQKKESGETVLVLRHALAREVADASLPAAARGDLHQRCANELGDDGAPIELRALHATFASDPFQALVLLERVGDRALARGDDLGAALALRRGLERGRRELHRGEMDDPERAIAIFARKLGEALVREREVAEAEGVLREAMELVARGSVEWTRLLGTLARALWARGRTAEALRSLDDAVKAARRLTARELVAELLTLKAEIDRSLGNPMEAVTQLRAADESIRDAVRSGALGGGNRRTLGTFDDSMLSRQRLEVLIRLAGALRDAGRDDDAMEPLEDARQLAERLRLPGELARVESEAGENAERLGDHSGAVSAWRRAREAAAEAGNVIAEAQFREREGRLRGGAEREGATR